jgi:hypothetical protein
MFLGLRLAARDHTTHSGGRFPRPLRGGLAAPTVASWIKYSGLGAKGFCTSTLTYSLWHPGRNMCVTGDMRPDFVRVQSSNTCGVCAVAIATRAIDAGMRDADLQRTAEQVKIFVCEYRDRLFVVRAYPVQF